MPYWCQTSLKAEPAPENREQEIAYCNTEDFAIKIYTLEGSRPSSSGADAMIRIYDRSDRMTFINRTPVSQETGTQEWPCRHRLRKFDGRKPVAVVHG